MTLSPKTSMPLAFAIGAFTKGHITNVRKGRNLRSHRARRDASGYATAGDLAARYNVTRTTIRHWAKNGLLERFSCGHRHRWYYRVPVGVDILKDTVVHTRSRRVSSRRLPATRPNMEQSDEHANTWPRMVSRIDLVVLKMSFEQFAIAQHDGERVEAHVGAQDVETVISRILGDPPVVDLEVLVVGGLEVTPIGAFADERLVAAAQVSRKPRSAASRTSASRLASVRLRQTR
jgi:hypothetical protein